MALQELADPRSAQVILTMLAPLTFIAAGFTLMFGHRRFALRLVVLGAFLAAAAAIAPGLMG